MQFIMCIDNVIIKEQNVRYLKMLLCTNEKRVIIYLQKAEEK